MPIEKRDGLIIETAPQHKDRADRTHVFSEADFAICKTNDVASQLKYDLSEQDSNTTVVIASDSDEPTIHYLPHRSGRLMVEERFPYTLRYISSEQRDVVVKSPVTIIDGLSTVPFVTLRFPLDPYDGESVTISSQINLNTVRCESKHKVLGNAFSFEAGQSKKFIYVAQTQCWYRIG